MTAEVLFLDGSARVDLEGLFERTSWAAITFEHYDEETNEPLELTGDWTLRVILPESYPQAFKEFTSANGLTTAEHILTFKKPADILIPANTYHYEIINSMDDSSAIIYKGLMKVLQ